MSDKSGLDVLRCEFEQDKAQVANPKGKAHARVCTVIRVSFLGESPRLPMEAAAALMMFEALMGAISPILSNNPFPGQATELLASNPVVSHPNREGKSFSEVDSRTTVELR